MAKDSEHGRSVKVGRGVLAVLLNIIFYTAILIALVKIGDAGYQFSYEVFGDTVTSEEQGPDVTFSVLDHESVLSVSKRLEDQGFVTNAYSFFIRAKISESSKVKLRPGEYKLHTGMTYSDIVSAIMRVGDGEDSDGQSS